jgi:TolB-like protein
MLSPLLSLVVLLGAQGTESSASTDPGAPDAATQGTVAETAGAPEASAEDGDEKPRILVLELAAATELDATAAKTLTGLLTAEVARDQRVAALSGDDIKELMALEGEKAALGCDESASCLAEIAGAMGARFVVSGRLSKLDQTLVLQVNLFDAQAAEAIARSVHKATSSDQLADKLATIADELVKTAEAALEGKLDGTAVTLSASAPAAEKAPVEGGLPVILIGGAAVAGAGVLLSVLAWGTAAVAYPAFNNMLGLNKDAREVARVATFAGIVGGLVGLMVIAGGAGVAGVSFLVEE